MAAYLRELARARDGLKGWNTGRLRAAYSRGNAIHLVDLVCLVYLARDAGKA
ncbi:MAG: hypothetical protein HP491_14550 [Nitrospira sp.]|nr:hypothetical protein [Nitrospira sp.]